MFLTTNLQFIVAQQDNDDLTSNLTLAGFGKALDLRLLTKWAFLYNLDLHQLPFRHHSSVTRQHFTQLMNKPPVKAMNAPEHLLKLCFA